MAGFDSLYTGITGLNAYQSWIDLISNDIANVDTVGFKGQTMTFADLFYQNQTFPTAPTNTNGGIDGQQLGFGVQIGSVQTNFGQGGLQTTGVYTDLAINGDGFFILNNLQGSAVPTYTRDGAFSLNQNGVLYDPANGLAVQGWMANSSGVVTTGGTTGNITIPIGLTEQAQATGTGAKVGPTGDSVFDVALGGNLDQTQWQQSFLNSVGASSTNGAPYTVTATLYDSLGNPHLATITYVPVASNATPATAAVSGTTGNVAKIQEAPATNQNDTITITVNAAGTLATATDTLGNTASVTPGGQFTMDGATVTMAATLTGRSSTKVTVTAATNGLPATVYNASGTGVKPATRWAVDVSFSDGTTFQTLATPGEVNKNGTLTTAPTLSTGTSGLVGYVYFDQNGQFINTSTIQGDNTDPGGTAYQIGTGASATYVHAADSTPTADQGNLLSVTQWGKSAGNNASPAAPGTIALGFWQDASLAGASTANVISQNGYASGTLENITIGADGTVIGAFTNGQNKTLAQIALARFQNEQGLSRIGGNQFEATANSGLAQVGVAGTGVLGSIQSGALEQSNVSLAQEFTNLIVAQRAFEANTRGISTADQNLQTVIHLQASEN
jgi:flagellar hook protein FlgE